MPVPVQFERELEVEPGRQVVDRLQITNTFHQVEHVDVALWTGESPPDTLPPRAGADLGLNQARTFGIRHDPPQSHEPGVSPFTLVATFQNRRLRLRMPGIRRIRAVGDWDVRMEAPEGAQATEGGEGQGRLALRPWHDGTERNLVITNRRSDWLYCRIDLENTNRHWDYRLASRVVCVPPWAAAGASLEGPKKRSLADTLMGAMRGDAAGGAPPPPPAAAVRPDPQSARIQLLTCPRKKKWFGKLPKEQAENKFQITVRRLDPETGQPADERPHQFTLAIDYQTLRGPGEFFKAIWNRVGPVARFIFSRKGLLTLGIPAALIVMFAGAWKVPGDLAYDAWDKIKPPKLDKYGVSLTKDGTAEQSPPPVNPGQKIYLHYAVENGTGATLTATGFDKSDKYIAEQADVLPYTVPTGIDSGELSLKFRAERRYNRLTYPRNRNNAPNYAARAEPVEIKLKVASKPVVPDLTETDWSTASQQITAAGGIPKKRTQQNTAPADTVLKTIPAAGSDLAKGQSVIVVVSAGPPAPPVPSEPTPPSPSGPGSGSEGPGSGSTTPGGPTTPGGGERPAPRPGGEPVRPPPQPRPTPPPQPEIVTRPVFITQTDKGRRLAEQLSGAAATVNLEMAVMTVAEALDNIKLQKYRFLVIGPDVPERAAANLVRQLRPNRPVVIGIGESGLTVLRQMGKVPWPSVETRTVRRLELSKTGDEVVVLESAAMAVTSTTAMKKVLLEFREELISGGSGHTWYWAIEDLDQQLTESGLRQFAELMKNANSALGD